MSSYLTCAQVADEVGVSTRTVMRWVAAGDLPAVRLPGGRLRVAQADLAARLAAWSTRMPPTNASGPAQCDLPGPGTGGESHA